MLAARRKRRIGRVLLRKGSLACPRLSVRWNFLQNRVKKLVFLHPMIFIRMAFRVRGYKIFGVVIFHSPLWQLFFFTRSSHLGAIPSRLSHGFCISTVVERFLMEEEAFAVGWS